VNSTLTILLEESVGVPVTTPLVASKLKPSGNDTPPTSAKLPASTAGETVGATVSGSPTSPVTGA